MATCMAKLLVYGPDRMDARRSRSPVHSVGQIFTIDKRQRVGTHRRTDDGSCSLLLGSCSLLLLPLLLLLLLLLLNVRQSTSEAKSPCPSRPRSRTGGP